MATSGINPEILRNDFYTSINQEWLSDTIIPQNEAYIGTFTIARQSIIDQLINLVENESLDSEFKSLRTLYNQFKKRENLTQDVLKYIDLIKNIKSVDQFRKIILVELFITHDIPNPLNFDCKPNINNSNYNVLGVENNGLGLIDKELYFDSEKEDIRVAYKLFLHRYLSFFGLGDYSEDIYRMEENIARLSHSNVQKRIRSTTNINLSNDSSEYTHFIDDLKLFLSHNNIICSELNISIYNVGFITEFYNIWLKEDKLELLKKYYSYLLLLHLGKYISSETEQILFEFYKTVLRGIKTQKDIKYRAFDILELNLETILGKLYMKHFFTEEKKQQICIIINLIFEEFKKRFATSWMQQETKQKALDKLEKMNVKIGGPKQYTTVTICSNNNLIANVLSCGKSELLINMIDICGKVNKSKWYMGAHQINAYYIREMNEIVFPAGILQPPFLTGDMISDFGSIGIIIAHEISHGFDDLGSKYDGEGNYKDWWSTEDRSKYLEIANSIKQLFNKLKIQGQNMNGELTLGENISDVCGTSIALGALKSYKKLDDQNPDIQILKTFFESIAKLYKFKFTKEEELRRLISDTHAHPKYRTNIVLSQLDDFYRAYPEIVKDDEMFIETDKRVKPLF